MFLSIAEIPDFPGSTLDGEQVRRLAYQTRTESGPVMLRRYIWGYKPNQPFDITTLSDGQLEDLYAVWSEMQWYGTRLADAIPAAWAMVHGYRQADIISTYDASPTKAERRERARNAKRNKKKKERDE